MRESHEVQLTVTGVQKTSDGSEERSEIQTEALYYEKDGLIFLKYRDEDILCELVLGEDRILLKRGAGRLKMIAGEATACEYETPYGWIPMRVHTQSVVLKKSPRSIYARAHYRLQMIPDYETQNMVTIKCTNENR